MVDINYLVTKRRRTKADQLIFKVRGEYKNRWQPEKFEYTALVNEEGKIVIDKVKIDSRHAYLIDEIKQDNDIKEAIDRQIILWNLAKKMEQSIENDIVIMKEKFTDYGDVHVFSIEFMLKNIPYASFEMKFYKNEERSPLILYNYMKKIYLRGSIEKKLKEKARKKLCKQILMQSTQKVKLIANGYQLV